MSSNNTFFVYFIKGFKIYISDCLIENSLEHDIEWIDKKNIENKRKYLQSDIDAIRLHFILEYGKENVRCFEYPRLNFSPAGDWYYQNLIWDYEDRAKLECTLCGRDFHTKDSCTQIEDILGHSITQNLYKIWKKENQKIEQYYNELFNSDVEDEECSVCRYFNCNCIVIEKRSIKY